jgi:hypothetical protein
MKRKKVYTLVSFIAGLIIIAAIAEYSTFGKIPRLFRLNAQLKAEGYYMGDFEFKMVGLLYYIDHGYYYKAFTEINRVYKQMKSREGLIKVPHFSNRTEEQEFYLNLQNPSTGAFMDESYPLCTYIGPTMNVLKHLELLAKAEGKKVRLKYPLKFLDQINTPEKLEPFLDDLSLAGWLVSKLPQTPYIIIFEINDYQDFERVNVYKFSDEWKRALLKWYYQRQDASTGFWGPRSRSDGHLLKSGDVDSTYHISKLFIDDMGRDIYPEFPIIYRERMLETLIQKLSEPMPEDYAGQHDWSLARYRALRILMKKLWPGILPEQRQKYKQFIGNIMETGYLRFYVKKDGAFSFYANASDADLDGTGESLSLLTSTGAFSPEEQQRLWNIKENMIDKGVINFSELKESDLDTIQNSSDTNSIRIYTRDPFSYGYTKNLAYIVYPAETEVPDAMHLISGVDKWLINTPQKMGNWVSKESIIQNISSLKFLAPEIIQRRLTTDIVNIILKGGNQVVVVSFDKMQIPKYKMIIRF